MGAFCVAALCSRGGSRVYRSVNPGSHPSALDMYALPERVTNIWRITGKSLYLLEFGDV